MFGSLYVTVSRAQGVPPPSVRARFFFGFIHLVLAWLAFCLKNKIVYI